MIRTTMNAKECQGMPKNAKECQGMLGMLRMLRNATGQEIEDVHIFGGQTPVKRLENLNVCRENEFFSQVLNDQIRSS